MSMGDCPRCWSAHCSCLCRDPKHYALERANASVADSERLLQLAQQRIRLLEEEQVEHGRAATLKAIAAMLDEKAKGIDEMTSKVWGYAIFSRDGWVMRDAAKWVREMKVQP